LSVNPPTFVPTAGGELANTVFGVSIDVALGKLGVDSVGIESVDFGSSGEIGVFSKDNASSYIAETKCD